MSSATVERGVFTDSTTVELDMLTERTAAALSEREADDVVRPRNMYDDAESATAAVRQLILDREYRWNWELPVALGCCVAFWGALIYGLIALP